MLYLRVVKSPLPLRGRTHDNPPLVDSRFSLKTNINLSLDNKSEFRDKQMRRLVCCGREIPPGAAPRPHEPTEKTV